MKHQHTPVQPPRSWKDEERRFAYTIDRLFDEVFRRIGKVPTKTSDLTNDSGFITTETDPTVPAWAKASSKPTYTAQEVGALPSSTVIPSKVSDLTDDVGIVTKATVTATLTADGWSSSTQAVTVPGVTSSNTIVVSPSPADAAAYASAGVRCTAQATNALTFTCANTPTAALAVNVMIL